MVTHDPVAASRADRVVSPVGGRVHGEPAGATRWWAPRMVGAEC